MVLNPSATLGVGSSNVYGNETILSPIGEGWFGNAGMSIGRVTARPWTPGFAENETEYVCRLGLDGSVTPVGTACHVNSTSPLEPTETGASPGFGFTSV